MAYSPDKKHVLKSLSLDSKLYYNFESLYGRDNFRKLVINTLDKSIHNQQFLEFVLFDPVDDFISTRTLVNKKVEPVDYSEDI